MVVAMPTGKKADAADMVQLNSGFAQALQLLTKLFMPTRRAPMPA